MRGTRRLLAINGALLPRTCSRRNAGLRWCITAWIAPRLVSFDLADNALPILLSHPISRFGYVLGKFIALFASLSVRHWIPCSPAVCLSGLLLAAAVGGGQSSHSRRPACRRSLSGLRFSPSSAWRCRRGSSGEWWLPVSSSPRCLFPPAWAASSARSCARSGACCSMFPCMMTELWQRCWARRTPCAPRTALAHCGHCGHARPGMPALCCHAECAHSRSRGGARMTAHGDAFDSKMSPSSTAKSWASIAFRSTFRPASPRWSAPTDQARPR